MFKDSHPTSTAGTGRPNPQGGRVRDSDLKETDIWSCPHCGMFNNIKEDSPHNSQGEGIAYVVVPHTIPSGTRNVTEGRRVSGCSLCGRDYTQNSYGKPLFSSVNLQGK